MCSKSVYNSLISASYWSQKLSKRWLMFDVLIFLHPLPKLLQFASRYNVAKFKMAVRFSVSKTFVTATNNGVWNVKFNSLWTVITFYWSRRV